MAFTVEEREAVRDRLVERARSDPRIVACALVGAEAGGRADRWSDLDLTFAVAGGAGVQEVLADWTREMTGELGAAHLFDLPVASTVYRVFLLPSSLQVDLSFTPERDFAPRGPRFRLLFGAAGPGLTAPRLSASHLFGMAAHHAVRARISVERGRSWQAEYWISGVRDQALTLACLREGLETSFGRGFDGLPPAVHRRSEDALVRSTGREELLRALGAAIELLLAEGGEAGALADGLAQQLRELPGPLG